MSVFELPFDVVHHRRDGIEYLEDKGIHATSRDSALGETIVAYQIPAEHRGITVWKQALCLAPKADGWFVQDLAQQQPERLSFLNLMDACDHVIAAWLDPAWRRLGRDEAKRLLARSRMPNLAQARKLEVLDEYLVYANATDIEEAIQAGELPRLVVARRLARQVVVVVLGNHGGGRFADALRFTSSRTCVWMSQPAYSIAGLMNFVQMSRSVRSFLSTHSSDGANRWTRRIRLAERGRQRRGGHCQLSNRLPVCFHPPSTHA